MPTIEDFTLGDWLALANLCREKIQNKPEEKAYYARLKASVEHEAFKKSKV